MAPRIPRNVKKWGARPFSLRSRIPNMAVQDIAPEGQSATMNPPRITPQVGVTQYGKRQQKPGFSTTGLTGES